MTNLRLRTWAVAGALLLSNMSAAGAPIAPAIPQVAVPVPCDPWVEFVRSIAWPATALIMALLFRRPIGAFVSALGARVTKLSLFKVEFELVPASSATSTPLLDDIRTATTSAQISDSSRMMLEQVQAGGSADYAKIVLGKGNEWLTSRLFIGAVMLERMRNLQVMVFVESRATTDERFLAVAPVQTVRWALAQQYPHLEAAWAHNICGPVSGGCPHDGFSTVDHHLQLRSDGFMVGTPDRHRLHRLAASFSAGAPACPHPAAGIRVTSIGLPDSASSRTLLLRDRTPARRHRLILRRHGDAEGM